MILVSSLEAIAHPFRTILIAILFALFSMVVPGPSGAETKDFRVVILDGRTESYVGQDGIPNWQVIEAWIKAGLPSAAVTHVNLGSRKKAIFLEAKDVAAAKPTLVIFHWSTFGENSKEGFCRPYSRGDWMDCTDRLLSLLQSIYEENSDAFFIGFSRAENLCARSFQASVANRVKLVTSGKSFTERTLLVAMGERNGKEWRHLPFSGERVQNEWLELISAASKGELLGYSPVGRDGRICRLSGGE